MPITDSCCISFQTALSRSFFAEREGFEPPSPFRPSVFKTDAIDHSAILPMSVLYFLRMNMITDMPRTDKRHPYVVELFMSELYTHRNHIANRQDTCLSTYNIHI